MHKNIKIKEYKWSYCSNANHSTGKHNRIVKSGQGIGQEFVVPINIGREKPDLRIEPGTLMSML